ncbi:unnamed protein product [Ceratitis capitata]|uniref:(Mediterranean fruit fly) hypothetical protein n=1 Tax=Ceratitis capitata TaxID=7213 RepID=A0A811V021_CERCA|nr:unnamed protein product [Ceratitis capitata]
MDIIKDIKVMKAKNISIQTWSCKSRRVEIEVTVTQLKAKREIAIDSISADFVSSHEPWGLNHGIRYLHSYWGLDSAFKDADNNYGHLFALRSDSLVMMAWRCKNFRGNRNTGYVLDPHNIGGISRLRGQTLKRLEISMIDRTPTEARNQYFTWPKMGTLNPNNLHPALGYLQVSEDIRDDYVFDLIRRDLGY